MSALLNARKVTTVLRRVPGTYPILNMIRKRFYNRGGVTVSDFDGTLKMRLDLGEHMGSQIFWFGYYSRDCLRVIDKLLRSGDAFLDIGANMGEVSLFAAKRVGPRGSVFAFEPMSEIVEVLRTNVHLNEFSNVTIIPLGVSGTKGEQPIYVSADTYQDGSWHNGLGTLYASDERRKCAGSIHLTTIDAFVAERGINRIDGIKIDIEGAELPALIGAKSVLSRFKPWILLEIGRHTCAAAGYEPEAILDFLDAFGYEYLRIGRKGKTEPVNRKTLHHWQNILCRVQRRD